jgi:hypothetical protein
MSIVHAELMARHLELTRPRPGQTPTRRRGERRAELVGLRAYLARPDVERRVRDRRCGASRMADSA